jgi:hypothetical protein
VAPAAEVGSAAGLFSARGNQTSDRTREFLEKSALAFSDWVEIHAGRSQAADPSGIHGTPSFDQQQVTAAGCLSPSNPPRISSCKGGLHDDGLLRID